MTTSVGDVVEYEGHRWRVYKADAGVRTVSLVRWGGATEEIADDDPKLVFFGRPSEWPVVTARVKPNAGPLMKLGIARGVRLEDLQPLVDWVPSDLMRPGGSIFIHPRLKLKVGNVLVAEYRDGTASRIVITQRYGTIAQRKIPRARVQQKKGLMDILDGEDVVE